MLISFKRRFIFIHVYRTGGNSVAEALSPYIYRPERSLAGEAVSSRWRDRRALIEPLIKHYHGHIKAVELQEALPRTTWDCFYKFTFVRNPWDWQVSMYHFVTQNTKHPNHDEYKAFGTFDNYLMWRIDQEVELQKSFVVGRSGEVLVDFVGRHEDLQRDFATVSRSLGLDTSLQRRNVSEHEKYGRYYTPRTAAMVADAYRADIEFFGYEFSA